MVKVVQVRSGAHSFRKASAAGSPSRAQIAKASETTGPAAGSTVSVSSSARVYPSGVGPMWAPRAIAFDLAVTQPALMVSRKYSPIASMTV